MDKHLFDLCSQYKPLAEGTATWGEISLKTSVYINDCMPPDHLITSVRGVVLRGTDVLVIQDEGERYHVVPGGQREAGETIEETLRREILEETGWTFTDPVYIGFIHFHHITPRPEGYQYPYPDFCQLYFIVQAEQYQPEQKLDDSTLQQEYVLGSEWMTQEKAMQLLMDESQYALLNVVKLER